MTKKRLSLPSSGRTGSVKRSCSSVGDHRKERGDHGQGADQGGVEPRYTIRRLAHYTSMVGNMTSDTMEESTSSSPVTDTLDTNKVKMECEKQYR